eukprot:4549823-Pleurochrysis_carterae.AAC.1
MGVAESCSVCLPLKRTLPPQPPAPRSQPCCTRTKSEAFLGIPEPSVSAFNAFVHTIQRLHRSLPVSARLPDTVLSEKVVNAVRRLSDSISTLLDVKLALYAGVGNLAMTISAARGVLSDTEARNMRREL